MSDYGLTPQREVPRYAISEWEVEDLAPDTPVFVACLWYSACLPALRCAEDEMLLAYSFLDLGDAVEWLRHELAARPAVLDDESTGFITYSGLIREERVIVESGGYVTTEAPRDAAEYVIEGLPASDALVEAARERWLAPS
jgi:hypothetical protein